MFPPGEITIFAAKASHLSHFFFRLKKIIPWPNLVMTFTVRHGISMALIEIDGFTY